MINIRPYEYGDIGDMDLVEEATPFTSQWAWTIADEHGPIAVFTLVEFWSGVGHISGYVDKRAPKHGLSFTRAARNLFRMTILAKTEYHRIQTYVFNENNARWARTMGLVYESTMVHGSPDGSDVQTYCYLR